MPVTMTAPAASVPAPAIRVGQDGAGCFVTWAGERVEDVGRRAAAWPDKRPALLIQASEDAPYRCIGAVIYAVQQAGFRRVSFLVGDKANIAASGPKCRITLNGMPADLPQIRQQAPLWRAAGVPISFRAAPQTSRRCVDQVVGSLSGSAKQRVIIGNEALGSDRQ